MTKTYILMRLTDVYTTVTNSTVWIHFDANRRVVIYFVLYNPKLQIIYPNQTRAHKGVYQDKNLY